MGLFDMFGAGGGRLAIQPQSAHVSAGGALAGVVGFQGGTRAQQITAITLKLVIEQTTTQMTQQGPRPTSQTRDVVPAHPLTGPFTSTPGQVQQFAFNLVIPPGVPNTTPGAVKYRLVASADIDGEIDPGANVEIQVVGGAPVHAAVPAQVMPGHMMPMGMPAAPMGPPQIGQSVMAQWQDGQWHPARVVAMQNGMIGVDWVNPALGQSSWVHPQQVQHAQPPMPQAPMPMGMPAQPGMSHAQASAMKAQMNAQHAMQPAKPAMHDPHVVKKTIDPHAKHGAVAIGTPVLAQWQDGHWHPARVVALQNGVVGVDWDDAKLGQSSWVQPHQVRAR